MREFITNNRTLVGAGGIAGLVLLAFLAFGVFGIHTAFIDNEVSEAGPTFASGANPDQPTQSEPSEDAPDPPVAEDPEEDETEDPSEATEQPAIQTIASGSFEDSSVHSGTGDAVVLSDGSQAFLRFQDNFATDNGPDLNVYLRANDDSAEFLDLGDLKGNIGSQNYEIPAGTDLSRFTLVDIWCVRFGVSFTEAELA